MYELGRELEVLSIRSNSILKYAIVVKWQSNGVEATPLHEGKVCTHSEQRYGFQQVCKSCCVEFDSGRVRIIISQKSIE